MTLPQPVRRYSVGEYYELERKADYKSDFYHGEIFAMAGGTARHSRITSNINREVGNQLKGTSCVTYESNLRLKATATGLRTYPDVSVYCHPLERDHEDSDGETYTNPTVLFEVLSSTTEAYDRGLNSSSYRTIQSLKAYVLVSQDEPHAEIYERQSNNTWMLHESRGLDELLEIAAIHLRLPLRDVYDQVNLQAQDSA
jgi:Uma2 family endonuclease